MIIAINDVISNSRFVLPNIPGLLTMSVNRETYQRLKTELDAKKVMLVAVSKTKPIEDIMELYDMGHRDFGENYVQELVDKAAQLPHDVRWHFIGHLQRNKVKYIATFVQLIHGVDSLNLLEEINKQAEKNKRVIDCLLQVHIAEEETKFGLDEKESGEVFKYVSAGGAPGTRVCGLMGMASFTDDMNKVRNEFRKLKTIFDRLPTPDPIAIGSPPDSYRVPTLSMGMSSDYRVAIEEGSTMVRIGSLLFGERAKPAGI
jgi:PLP dependent protein